MISSGVNLVMTVIGFCVSTLFIVFICTRLICARIQLHASRSRRSAAAAGLGIMVRGLHGLEPVMISKFPTKKYSDEFFSCIEHSQYDFLAVSYFFLRRKVLLAAKSRGFQ